MDVAEVEFNLGINFEDDEDIEFPEEEEEENPVEEIVDDRDRRIKKEHFKASKGRVTEDSEKSEKPSVWKGTFTYKFQDIDVRFDAEAYVSSIFFAFFFLTRFQGALVRA